MNGPELAVLHNRLATEVDPARRNLLLNRLWETEVRSFTPVSDSHGVRPTAGSVTLREVQTSLRADEALIEYVLGSPRSFALAITNSGAAGYRLPDRTEIEGAAERYRASIAQMREDRGSAAWLYKQLLEPVDLARGAHRPHRSAGWQTTYRAFRWTC